MILLTTGSVALSTAPGDKKGSDQRHLQSLVSVRGRVINAYGQSLANTIVVLTHAKSEPRLSRTNAFGYFFFDGVSTGSSYTVSVSHKSYEFNPGFVVINVEEEVSNIFFIGKPIEPED